MIAVKTSFSALVLFAMVSANDGTSPAKQRKPIAKLSYAGYSLDTKLGELSGLFPNSQHDSRRDGHIVWVSPRDVRADRLYYLQFDGDPDGKIRSARLSFEIPYELRKKVRGPRCKDVEASLVKQYGPVMEEERPYHEEATLHEPKIWFNEATELVWDCGEYAVTIRPRTPAKYREDRRVPGKE